MTIDELLYLQSGEKLPHLSDPITIDNLLLQFKFGSYEIEKIRDDVPGKTMVVFKTPITWRDEDSRIFQFIALYDENTKIVKALRIYGFGLQSDIDYATEHNCYLWCPVLHYIEDLNCSAPTVTFITSF